MAPQNQKGKAIVPVTDHFPARVTYRDSSALSKIKKKFEESGLIERVKQTPFRQFFEAEELKFSGALYHSMMLRKTVCSKDSEVQFCFGSLYARFGLTGHALITGLNFSKEPFDAEMKEHYTSDRILDTHFNGMSEKLVLKQLEDALASATDLEDIFKLGLCCPVEGVLIAHEPKSKITVSYLRMVDDLEFFFKYPWEKVSFEKMMSSLKKDMLHQLSLYREKLEKEEKAKHVAQYTVYGYALALLYWTYEVITEIKDQYSDRIPGSLMSRMLQWRSKKDEPTHQSTAEILNRRSKLTVYAFLSPRSIENDYHAFITHTELPLHLRVGDEEIIDNEPTEGVDTVAQSRRLEQIPMEANLFDFETDHDESRAAHHHSPDTAPQPRQVPSSSDAGDFIIPEHPVFQNLLAIVNRMDHEQQKILANQQVMLEKLDQLDKQKIMADQQIIMANQQAMIDKLGQLDQQKIVVDQQTILANQKAMIVTLGQLQSVVDILTAGADEAGSGDEDAPVKGDGGGLAVEKRTRKRPTALKDYTDPMRTKKKKPNVVPEYRRLELHERPNESDIRFWLSWLLCEITTHATVNCFTAEHDVSWFSHLKIRKTWLQDSHIDAAFHLLRRRRHHLRDKFCLTAIVLTAAFQEQFNFIKSFGGKIGKEELGTFMYYVNGDKNEFLAPWYPGVQEIYFSLHVNNHWVVVEASLVKHKFTIYDSGISANSDKAMEEEIDPFCKYFPVMLKKSMKFNKLNLPTEFGWRRCKFDEVPQMVDSDDCGMFEIKHIEHLMTERPIKSIISEKMQEFRNEWCLDLFYQTIRMPVVND